MDIHNLNEQAATMALLAGHEREAGRLLNGQSFDVASTLLGKSADNISLLRTALTGLIEKYEEVVSDEDAGRSLEDAALVEARNAVNA